MADEPLACPACATTHPLSERFCPRCHMPLVYAGSMGVDQPVTERQERARKIKRQYAEGRLVRVAGARNLSEAEFLQGMLLEEGIPSMQRRTAGFDVPDFLAAGPREILVAQSGEDAARDVLLQARPDQEGAATPDSPAARSAAPRYTRAPATARVRLLAGVMLAVAVLTVVLFMGTHIWG